MIAAAAGRPYHINFNGRYQFQFADDAAKAFVRAARAAFQGAAVFSLGGAALGVDEIVQSIETNEPGARGRITFGDQPLALPEAFDGRPIVEALGPTGDAAGRRRPRDPGLLPVGPAHRRARRGGPRPDPGLSMRRS